MIMHLAKYLESGPNDRGYTMCGMSVWPDKTSERWADVTCGRCKRCVEKTPIDQDIYWGGGGE